MSKAVEAFRTISEVAADLEVPKHVLRFWEAKFPQIRPMKRGGGRRYYRPEDMELLRGIRHLLHAEGYTIKGVQKILREQGIDHVKNHSRELAAARAAEAGTAKRGRKPIVRAEVRDTKPAQSKAAPASLATVQSPPSRVSERRARVEAIIVELDACRRMLLSDPMPAEEKGTPRRAAGAGRG